MKHTISRLLTLALAICLCCAVQSKAAEPIRVYMDAGKGTWHTEENQDWFNSEFSAEAGTTLASMGKSISHVTSLGRDFLGWIAYDADGKAISGLLTSQEVLDYPLPNHNISFVVQWQDRPGYPVTNITYAAYINGTGQPDPNVTISIEAGGLVYSARGALSIPKSIYSTWTGKIYMTIDTGASYIQRENKWRQGVFVDEYTVKSYIKEGSAYWSSNQTGKGKEVLSPRHVINEYLYSIRDIMPDVALVRADSAAPVGGDAPELHSLSVLQVQSGGNFSMAMSALSGIGSNAILFDISAADQSGTPLHQLSGKAQVRLDLPQDFSVAAGSTVQIYYIPETGSPVACPTAFYDDAGGKYLIFETDHFSLYAAVVQPIPEPVEPTPAEPPAADTPAEPAPTEPPAPKPTPDAPTNPSTNAVNPTEPGPTTGPDAPVEPTPTPSEPPAPKPAPDAPATPSDPVTPVAPVAPVTPVAPAPKPTPAAPADPGTNAVNPSEPGPSTGPEASGIPTTGTVGGQDGPGAALDATAPIDDNLSVILASALVIAALCAALGFRILKKRLK